MKKILFNMGVMLSAALTLTNCTAEMDQPVQRPSADGTFEIIANTADTKTVNDGMSTKWAAGDTINVFHAAAGSQDYKNDSKFKIAEADLENGRFTGQLSETLDADGTYDWYAFFPYTSQKTSPADAQTGYAYIGHSGGLTQQGYDNMSALRGTVCPLYGVAKAVSGDQVPSLQMRHLTSVIAIEVTNMTDDPLTITSASFTAPESIVGSYYITFASGEPTYNERAGYVKSTATVNVTGGTALSKNEKATLYLAIKPFTASAGQVLTVSVNGYSKELALPKEVEFYAGKIKTLNFRFDRRTATFDFNANKWNLPVSDSDDGTAGNIEKDIESEGVTMSVTNQESGSNMVRLWNGKKVELRAYKGSTLTFSVPEGSVINKMIFKGDQTSGISTLTGVYESKEKEWSGSSNPVILDIVDAVYIDNISILYGPGESEGLRTAQTLSFPEASYTVTLGEDFVEPVLSGANTAVTYTSSNTTVATVDSNGELTILSPGITTITATAEADQTYANASASYTLNVNPKPSSNVLTLPWEESFSGDDPLAKYTIVNGGTTTKIYNDDYAGGAKPELLLSKSNGSISAEISTEGYTGSLVLTFKSNHSDYISVTSPTSGVTVSKKSDAEYVIDLYLSLSSFTLTLTNVKGSNARIDDISLVKTASDDNPGDDEDVTYGWLEMPSDPSVADADNYLGVFKYGSARNYTYLYDKSMYTTRWAAHPVYNGAIGINDRPSWEPNPNLDESQQINIWDSSYGVDYVGTENTTIYSRGHIVPNGDRNGISEMQTQVFYATNSVPQIQNNFNGSIWSNLEEGIRKELYSDSDTLYVVTGNVFNKVDETETIKYISPKNDTKQCPVPNYFYKVILKVGWTGKKISSAIAIGFWFDHKQYPKGSKYADYAVSVDSIEKWTGMDFFVNLPDDFEVTAESNNDWQSFQSF